MEIGGGRQTHLNVTHLTSDCMLKLASYWGGEEGTRLQMFSRQLKSVALFAVIAGFGVQSAWPRDLRVRIPKSSHLTPVQRLNREGVDAISRHQYEKAEALFYKAYLYDAVDPFTLNNLGYISELEGNLNRAQKFYALASEQGCNALIDLSSAKQLEGKPMTYALNSLQDVPMHVNQMNVAAIELLSQDRNVEADQILQRALSLEPQNPFTLNNLGVAEEARGDFENALKYYDDAASSRASEPVVIAADRSWRGKPVSEMAANSAQRLRKRMQNLGTAETRATMLTFRGVSATNQNDWSAARHDFLQAYSLDPDSAFSLNNRAYVAEKDGDLETAQFYYSKARKADDASARVGLATQSAAKGERLTVVAGESGLMVDNELAQYSQAERMQKGPVQLIPRYNSPTKPAETPKQPSAPFTPNAGPQIHN